MAYIISATITAAIAGLVGWWARRGSRTDSLEKRVARLENLEIWRGLVKQLDDSHTLVLEAHIFGQKPPPPPPRPIYPPMPA